MMFEYIVHEIDGVSVKFVVDQDNRDSYVEALRKKPIESPVNRHVDGILKGNAAERPVFADFGANIGVTSLLPALKGFRTIGVEASPKNFQLLVEAIKVNGLIGQYTPVFFAAHSQSDVLRFFDNSAWGGLSSNGTEGRPDDQFSSVTSDSISEILELYGFGIVDVVKIDIEGAELAALNGFERIVDRNPHVDVVFECNTWTCKFFEYRCQDLWKRFFDLGFYVYLLDGAKLYRVSDTDIQPNIVMDGLATKKTEEELRSGFGYEICDYESSYICERLAFHIRRNREEDRYHVFSQLQFIEKECLAGTLTKLVEHGG